MRTSLNLLLFAMLSSSLGKVAAESAKAPYSITISTRQSTVKAGAEVKVGVTLTNTSDHQIYLARSMDRVSGEDHAQVEILSENGNPPPETKYRRFLRGEDHEPGSHGQPPRPRIGSDISYRINTGKTLEDVIVVSKLYDLSKPGRYTIQVSRFDQTYSKTWVKSNKITLTVTP
jgi:hypothetical protein